MKIESISIDIEEYSYTLPDIQAFAYITLLQRTAADPEAAHRHASALLQLLWNMTPSAAAEVLDTDWRPYI
jgi:hypothetical protein